MQRVQSLCDQIVQRFQPQKVILFSRKTGLTGELSSFKLCIIADAKDKAVLERQIYLELDCEIPYDILLYQPEEWERMRRIDGTFAQKIERMGRVLYG